MMNTQSLNRESLRTFDTLSEALNEARIRVAELDDLDVVNEPEILAAFMALCENVVCDEAFTICTSEDATAVFELMADMSFCPYTSHHFCLGVCLFAAIHLRRAV